MLLVDNQELFRAGIRRMIDVLGCCRQVWEAGSGEAAVSIAESRKIDMVFIDSVLPGLDGISTAVKLRQIQGSTLKVVLLTGSGLSPVYKVHPVCDFDGYLTKSSSASEVAEVIKFIYSGKVYYSPELPSSHCDGDVRTREGGFDLLSQREMQVMRLLAQGYKTADAGRQLQLDSRTISTYKRRAFEKLGVSNIAELVYHALNCGVLLAPT
ncbi:hypothetical protein AB833_20100 [Chromatiales bacterium (ex Bugula neritina AB1)]|nr:hypothetical protein AB833_20100 [Chromatiales bacterium (ex Bugula neritina AB1)]